MPPSTKAPQWAENGRFITMLLFLGAICLFGGASRVDVYGLIFLQPFVILCLAVFLILPGAIRWRDVAVPLMLLAGLAAIMVFQLVPLPPEIWTQLPGHAPFADVAEAAGLPQPWRPISLTPDLTLASLVGLVSPLAAIIGIASLSVQRTYRLLPVLLAFVAVSILLGVGQISGGPRSSFYLYAITNSDSPVGLFSNRNHQAMLLAMTWPMLAIWATLPHGMPNQSIRTWIAAATAVLLVPILIITGSRAGLALGLLGLLFGLWQWRRFGRSPKGLPILPGISLKWFVLAAGLATVAAVIFVSRDATFQRLVNLSLGGDLRLQYLPVTTKIAMDFFWVGSGFGSFDPLFRYYEPFSLIQPNYFNHAHNDLVELVITGGVPALVLLISFVVWVITRLPSAFGAREPSRAPAFARLGAMIVAMLLLGSLVDYPLRTPLLSVLFALGCGWLAVPRTVQSNEN